MLANLTVQERNEVTDAVLTICNPDGTWTVYQEGDEIPKQYQYAVS
jgi:hypothetical protein